jgi:predicted O-methyltransferase YrrM
VRSHGVDPSYFGNVLDAARNDAYAAALGKLLRGGDTLLEIGAGTGLFAMLAVRAGAARVISCERDPAVADAARAVVARNGLADRITILTRDSRDLRLGAELEQPADALVWDNLSNNLIGAGGPETVADARRRLLRPGACIVPGRVEIRAALARDLAPHKRAMDEAQGFDLSSFNRLRRTNLRIPWSELELASEPATLFDYDFQSGEAPPLATRAEVRAHGGQADGIVQWLRFHLAPGVIYDTGAANTPAFGKQFHVISPVSLAKDAPVILCGRRDRKRTWFWASVAGA